MPELDGTLLWNIIITMVIVPFGWAFNKMFSEVKRLQLLLSETRESYSTKQDLRDTSTRIIETLHRLEDKLDKVLTNGNR